MELLLFNFYITRLRCDIIKLGVSSPEIDYRLDDPVNYPTVSKTATVAFVLPLSRWNQVNHWKRDRVYLPVRTPRGADKMD